MWSRVLTTVRGLFQRRRVNREVDEELQFHLEMETAANIEQGMSPGEASRRASMDLGGVVRTREAIREVRLLSIEAIWQDLRYAWRGIRKRPGFTALAVATLALGVGVNAASTAVAYGVLLRPLPYMEPSRVVIINQLFEDGGDLGFSPPVLQEWLPRLRTVDAAAAYSRGEVTVRSGGHATVVPAATVTGQFFDVLGTPPEEGIAGVSLDTAGVVVGRRAVADVLGPGASRPLDALLSVGDRGRTVVGVMPADFAFPDDRIALWIPSEAALQPGARSQDAGYSRIVARLKPGASIEQVRDDANRVRLELNPDSRETVSVTMLGESAVSGLHRLLTAAVVGALLVLLVACANVATLLIGRDVSREREMAARMALGASRGQLVRGVLVESALFAVLAAVAGTALGVAALKVFVAYASESVPGLHRAGFDLPVVLAVLGVTGAVTLLCGVLPAWHASHVEFSPFLRTSTGMRPHVWRARGVLVVGQIAASCVLLIGAGLLARTVSVLAQEDHGFQPAGALEARIVLSDRMLSDGAERQAFLNDVIERVRAMPGVRYAGFGSNLPPRVPPILIAIRVLGEGRDETRFVKVGSATPGYLRALGARFTAGRDFDDGDNRPEAPVVILSESVARFYYGDDDPIGRTFARLPALFDLTDPPIVVGVVQDMKYEGLDSPAGSAIYIPWALRPLGSGYLIVRTDNNPMRLASAIRDVARERDPTVPVPELQALEDAVAQSMANRRVRALPAIGFGALAFIVALVGVLATFMTLIAERRRDLAIRSALGASPGYLVRRIVGQGLLLAGIGIVVGLGVGTAGAQMLSSLLYRVSPLDVPTFAGTALLVGGGAVLTTCLAALRTYRVDPLTVLRSE